MLATILARSSRLPVKQAEAGDVLEAGHVYVAPPDAHLLVAADGTMQLDDRPPIHFLRPSADVLLESLASTYAGDCLAVVFSGTGSDGAAGGAPWEEGGGGGPPPDRGPPGGFRFPPAAGARAA